jgi:hypothetical protein
MEGGKCVLKCSITNGKGWRFTRDDFVDPFCMCTKFENGMGC